MRRHSAAPAATAWARCVSSWSHAPAMDVETLPKEHLAAKTDAVVGPVKVSKLPNGARIVSQKRDGPQVSLGAYIEAGAKFDPMNAPGMNYVLRWAMSGGNMDNSLFQMDRAARAFGAAREHVEVRKRFIGLKTEVMAGTAWEKLAEDLFTSVAAPRLAEYDVERFRDTMDNILEERRWQEPRDYAIDQLETVAFHREALGNPRYVAPEFNGASGHANLVEQWSTLCVPSRVVIAAVNVDHDALIAAYENAPFPHTAAAPHHARAKQLAASKRTEKSQFVPGLDKFEQENRVAAMGTRPDGEPEAIVALGFLAPGAESTSKAYATGLITRELAAMAMNESLNGGADPINYGLQSFYRPYSEAGLIGTTARSAPAESQLLVTEAAKILRSLSTENLAAAKARAAARFYAENLEVQRDYLDFLATSLVGDTMNRMTQDEIFSAINDVDAASIKAVVEGFKSTRPAMFAHGEVLGLPSLRQMGL